MTQSYAFSFMVRTLVLVLFVALSAASASAQSGHVLNGIGPAGQAWSGAGMANPQDALTALHWNPAAVVERQGRSLDLSLQLLLPTGTIASDVEAGAFGPFGPGAAIGGATDSDAGPFPIPAIGYLSHTADGRLYYGLSAFGVGGFGVDYPLDPTNPILTPQPPGGLGFGSVVSEFALLQVRPTVAYRLTDHVSIGLSPTFNYASLKVTPFPGTSPDDGNMDGFPSYPGAPKDWTPGFGAEAGVHYRSPEGLSAGLSIKSPQVFSDFEFAATGEAGTERSFAFNLDYPMIVSAGIGYSGQRGFEAAADVRYIDFENTDGFDTSGYDETGAVTGFGWSSIVVVAVGAQWSPVEGVPVRFGYSYNQNPIESDVAFFNTPSPAIIQHRVSGGIGFDASERAHVAVAVQYGIQNDVEGVWVTPFGPNPATLVRHELSTLTGVLGLTVQL